ncbi:MAG TPA: methyltransferase domain-containing protein [Chitinophagaceae bacterium]|nr:methyltransferase domain-containing protein [Chitinophagaceae bacterium]
MEINIATATDWFRHWFDTTFYHQLYAKRDEKEAAGFIDRLLAELNPAPGSRILDLGCGKGRHSKRLAGSHYDVTGLDLAASSIAEAKKWESHRLRFKVHDMRLSFGCNRFDFVFNLFTSFGYFQTAEEDQCVLRNITAALRPGGQLVLDYINTRTAEEKLIPFETREIDGVIYRIQRWTDEKHFFKAIVVEHMQGREPFVFTEQVRKFNLPDFETMFEQQGLVIEQVYGNYNLDAYESITSPRMILLAKKQ